VSKPTIYLRWDGKEQLPIDALASHTANVGDVDTGTLRGDLSNWRATFSTSRAARPSGHCCGWQCSHPLWSREKTDVTPALT
jgi:hypothetical protein